MELLLIVILTSLGSLCSVGLAGALLLFKKQQLHLVTSTLIPYAIGTLLAAALFCMIPHALSSISPSLALSAVLVGILIFYVLEKIALWRHCHGQACDIHTRAGTMILIGDSLHNFVDGVAIASAFAASISLGIVTAVAVIAHEIPQEVGDFAILIESGYSRTKAFLYNLFSSLTALAGAVLTYFLLPFVESIVPYMLAVSAASFIYVALADLIPGRRISGGMKSLLWELPLIALGIATITILHHWSKTH